MERSRSQPSIKVEREDTFSFARGTGTMDGDRLLITFGVRCLEVRTGWPQRPQSGIMRGNALAAADIVHFGLSRSNQYLSLIAAGPTPRWVSEGGEEFGLKSVAAHLSILTDG